MVREEDGRGWERWLGKRMGGWVRKRVVRERMGEVVREVSSRL